MPAPDPSLPFLCADKGKEAKENRPAEQRLFSNALGSLTPPRSVGASQPIHSSLVQGRVDILSPSIRLKT